MSGRMAAMTLAAAFPRPVLRELELSSLDAVHFPLTVMLPRVRRPPAVTSMHDVQHFYFPRFFSRAELAYRAIVYRWTARLSRRLITGTGHAKATLVERLGVEPDRVRVIPYGIDHERFRPDGREREPFLLYPANPWPHKNHARLFEAFELVHAKRPELRLVLTGHGHAAEAPPGVEVRGHVSWRSWQSCTARPRPSSSRACTRASASRRSRRWRAAARSRSRPRGSLPRGLRRRGENVRSDLRRGDGGGNRGRAGPSRGLGRARSRARAGLRLGDVRAAARGRLP